jgi:hypothetical protein
MAKSHIKLLQVRKVGINNKDFIVAISVGSIYVFPAVRVRYEPPQAPIISFHKVPYQVGDRQLHVHAVLVEALEFEVLKIAVQHELDAFLAAELEKQKAASDVQ